MLRLTDRLGLGCALYSSKSGVIAADKAFADIVGRDPEDVIGIGMEDVTHPDDISANAWLLERALKTGGSFAFCKRYRLPNLQDRWVQNRYTVFRVSDDEAFVSLQSRPVPQPAHPPELEPEVQATLPEYVLQMLDELARLAAAAGMTATAELLNGAAEVAADEARDRFPAA